MKKYHDIIVDQEKRGFIEKVQEISPPTVNVHYIPHHPVMKESTTTPVRIVYVCSCRQPFDEPSLNDCLESTPPNLNELTSILMRFRLNKYAVTTDIEKAFLHVRLHENDRDFTRFLWMKEPNDLDSLLVTYRFNAVLFGATCSPFMLNATLLKHLNMNKNVKAAKIIESDLYVDNVLSIFEDQTEAVTYFREARTLMSAAGMNLRSWSSNSDVVRSEATKLRVLDTSEIIKVLGLSWEPSIDVMSFVKREIPTLKIVTKRTILKYSSQIYDPLGLLSPVTVRAKLLTQELWRHKFEWDIVLPEEFQQKWKSLADDLNRVSTLKIPRRLLEEHTNSARTEVGRCFQLHIFVDASKSSYGAAAYLCQNGQSNLIMAKNGVAPLKSLTLPQLELMAAVVGPRLAKLIRNSIEIEDVMFWSDSQIVLYWLKILNPLRRFVQNRVNEIGLTNTFTWRYCPTTENPEDLTRGISANMLIDNRLWNLGAPWICDPSRWPTWEINKGNLQDVSVEEQTDQQTTCFAVQQTICLRNVIDSTKYSSYRKLLRVTAYVLRFIRNSRLPLDRRNLHHLTVLELQAAEHNLLRDCQASAVHEEILQLQSGSIRATLVKQLRLFFDASNLLRCVGRIHNAPLEDSAKFPILLPQKDSLTHLIIQDAHERHLHSGVNATVTNLCQKYWVPAIRQNVKSIIRKCVTCRRVTGQPYSAPDPPPLPKIRVEEAPPFTVTGVHFARPLYVKKKIGSESKAYACLFTCAATRAVHLEVLSCLSEDCFLQVLRRFIIAKTYDLGQCNDVSSCFFTDQAVIPVLHCERHT